jgi:hypothetical protein
MKMSAMIGDNGSGHTESSNNVIKKEKGCNFPGIVMQESP